MAMIEVQGLVKRFGSFVAVNGVSFAVDRGEILGFLGPNGAGKSTTMKMVTSFISRDAGAIAIAGHDVSREPLAARRRIGYLPESTPLYLEMGIIEFLTYVCELRGVGGAERARRLREVVDVCGLGPQIGKVIGALSKGYRQRVGLAQSLIHNPDILILDEPTSGLDPNQIVEIRKLIRDIGREKTVILSTHILSEVTSTCDRAIIINRGTLVAEGTPEELQARGKGGLVVMTTLRPGSATAPEVSEALGSLGGVGEVGPPEDAGEGRYRFAVRAADDGVDPSESIFRLAVEKGWALSELRPERATLEDVFRQLTMGEEALLVAEGGAPLSEGAAPASDDAAVETDGEARD